MPTLSAMFDEIDGHFNKDIRPVELCDQFRKALAEAEAAPDWVWRDCEGRPVKVGDLVIEGQYNRTGVVSTIYNNSDAPRVWVGGDGWTMHIEPGRCRLVPAAPTAAFRPEPYPADWDEQRAKREAADNLAFERAAALVALVATWREWAVSEAHDLADDSITLESSEWVPGPAADLPEHMACAEAMAAALDLCPPPAREGGDE